MAEIRPAPSALSVGQCATMACLLEATAPKPGNVHRGADFEDMTFADLIASAVAIGPVIERGGEWGVGQTVLAAVRATRRQVGVNTNLGTVLLLAPLACVPAGQPLARGVANVLSNLTPDDACNVYEAIRIAAPGGLGKVDGMDVAGPPPADLLAAMRAAAERDLVARQYVENFDVVLRLAARSLCAGRQKGWSLTDAIIRTHVELLARFGDSLIARKCGSAIARQASERAAAVLAAGAPGEPSYHGALADLDFWLRSDGHRRNPGTTADLIAAALFAVLRDRLIEPPYA